MKKISQIEKVSNNARLSISMTAGEVEELNNPKGN